MVYESYLSVMSKDGCAGIDRQSIDMFNENLSGNLYKVWNRMTSGSYFPPPVRSVLIPKKQGGFRPLGIPTVSDRTSARCSKELFGTADGTGISQQFIWVQTGTKHSPCFRPMCVKLHDVSLGDRCRH